MTPTATTRAAQNGRSAAARSTRPTTGHRNTQRRAPAPRAPRRVSGPVTGTSRPDSRRQRSRPAVRAARPAGIAAGAWAFVKSLPDHTVIDRLVRGRAWILALGVMLTGIVAMQVEVLKLGANIGRSVQRSSALSVRNEQLQANVASLADDLRIERLAAGMGMVMAPPGSVAFLPAQAGGNPAAAVRNLHAPDVTAFLNSVATNGTVVTPTALAAANAPAQPSATTAGTAAAPGPSTVAAGSAGATGSPTTTTPTGG